MSLVQAVISNHFIIVCSEQRANFDNGTVDENFKKVFKINQNVIIGMAGSISDNQKLFEDFLICDIDNCKLIPKEKCNLTLNEVFEIVTNKFLLLNKTPNFNTHSLVCGWDGSKFVGKTFYSTTGISDVVPKDDNDVKIISSGNDIHYNNFMKFKDKYPFSILGVKNAFKDVLDVGVKYDSSINENCTVFVK